MLTKGRAYLLTRTESIDYMQKTVKHNTFYLQYSWLYYNIIKKAIAVQYVLDILSNGRELVITYLAETNCHVA